MKKIKQIYKNIKFKCAFWIGFFVSLALLITSFALPPSGTIDPSVLQAVAEIGFFSLLGIVADAIMRGSDIKLSKGDVSIEVENPDTNNENNEQD